MGGRTIEHLCQKGATFATIPPAASFGRAVPLVARRPALHEARVTARPMPATPSDLFAFLDRLGIAHATVSHPPLFSVEQSRQLR